MADYRRTVVRAAALLYLAAVAIAAGSLYLPGIWNGVNLLPAVALSGLGALAAALVYAFPWHRYRPNWFLTVGIAANLHLGLFVWVTGGSQSPFWLFAMFIMLGSTAYFRDIWPLGILGACSMVTVVSPLVYEHPILSPFLAQLLIRGFIVIVTFSMGRWLFRAMDQSSARALRLEQSRSDFLFAVAHQLKTPLSSLQAALQALKCERANQARPLSAEARLLDIALRSEQRIGQQVNRLLEFFKMEAGQLELVLQSVSMAEVIESVVELLRPQIEAKKQRLTVEVSRSLPAVEADVERIETVLVNLLQNAVDFTPPEGRITLLAQASRGMVVVKVEDTGPGVPPEEQAHIFDPYDQTRTAPAADMRGSWSGTGLGLAIAKSIVELHHGRIWLEQTTGKGTAVCFSLPQANGAARR